VSGRAGGALVRDLFEASLHLFGDADFSSGDATTLAQGNWYVAAQSKAAGANTYRHHLWLYDPSGAGVMAHGVSTGSGTHGDGAALDTIRVGNGSVNSNGLVAVVGIWTSVLTDGQLDTLKSANLTAWSALAPQELITFENWNGTTGWSTRIGTSTFSAESGNVTVGANPPSFSFNLAASVDLTPVAMTLSPVAVSPVPGVVSVGLTPASMTMTPVAVSAVPGPVSINLAPATMIMSPGSVTGPTPGPGPGLCASGPVIWWAADQPSASWEGAPPFISWHADPPEEC